MAVGRIALLFRFASRRCVATRVVDLDCERHQITVREGADGCLLRRWAKRGRSVHSRVVAADERTVFVISSRWQMYPSQAHRKQSTPSSASLTVAQGISERMATTTSAP
jgi:hypothetical protein